jgi:GT2 family glycosyltransferase
MPVFETPPRLLRAAIQSVLAQTHPAFELIVVDDGSSSSAVAEVLGGLHTGVDRMRIVRRPVNGGIVAACDDALQLAGGEFVGVVDHDDLIEPRALEVCAEYLDENPRCDLLYTDEDWIDVDDDLVGPFWKPDWSPERLRAQNYVNHLTLFRRSVVEGVGGFRAGFDGSQDYDLVLRVSEQARAIVHVPQVLYHWRVRAGQVSGAGNPAVFAAARRAIEEHCERIHLPATVEQIHPEGIYRVRRRVRGQPLVSFVIPTRGSIGILRGQPRTFVVEAVRSILAKSSYPNLEFVIVADRDTGKDVAPSLAELCGDRLRWLWYDHPFNYSHKVNLGVASSTGEYVVLLNDDVEVITPDWIETLLSLVQQPDVAMAGCCLLFEDGTIQHGGHLYGASTAIGHIAYGAPDGYAGPEFTMLMERECSGVTAACAIVRKADFLAVGGFCRSLPFNYNDVDFSLKLRNTGKRIVWTPFARLYHFESKSRQVGVGTSERDRLSRRWSHVLDRGGDPYWRYPVPDWAAEPVGPAL